MSKRGRKPKYGNINAIDNTEIDIEENDIRKETPLQRMRRKAKQARIMEKQV